MRRRLAILFTTAIVALAAIVTLLWIRSYQLDIYVAYSSAGLQRDVKARRGEIIWTELEMPQVTPVGWEVGTLKLPQQVEITNEHGLVRHNMIVFRDAELTGPNLRIKSAAIPFWCLGVPLVLVALICLLLVTVPSCRVIGRSGPAFAVESVPPVA